MQLSILPSIGPFLTRLSQSGVREQDIVDIAELLKDNTGISNSSKGSIRIEEIRSLISELRACGSIKSTIGQLSQNKLRDQVVSLRAEKRDLNAQNQRMFSTLQYSKQLVSFFSGSSASLRNEITGLISMMVYTIYLLNIEAERLEKLRGRGNRPPDSEFMPLALAARGENVDLGKLKVAVTRSIEVMLERLNNNSELKKILSNGRLALSNEQL